MNIETDNSEIAILLSEGKLTGKKLKKIPKSAIKGFVKAVSIIRMANRIEDLYRYCGLDYKRLEGDLNEYESVRCDRRYRLIFKSYADENETIVTNINIIKISDHYGDL